MKTTVVHAYRTFRAMSVHCKLKSVLAAGSASLMVWLIVEGAMTPTLTPQEKASISALAFALFALALSLMNNIEREQRALQEGESRLDGSAQ